MARTVGLSAYKIEIRNHRKHTPWKFFLGTEADGYNAVRSYLEARLNHLVPLGDIDPDTGETVDNRAIKLVRLDCDKSTRMLAGIFMKGEAGLVQEIHDFTGSQDDPTYTLSKHEGALTPLYFRFHLRDGLPYGIAMLQTFGKDGLKGYISDDTRRYFGNQVPTLSFKLIQILDAQVLHRFAKEGRLQDVVLVNSGKTERSRNAMQNTTVGGDTLGEDGDKLLMRVHKKGGWASNVLKKLVRAVKQHEDVSGLVHSSMEAIDDLLVEIKRGDRVQTFSLMNPDDSPIREDITNAVVIGANGFPTWDSLHGAAENSWQSIRQILGG